MAAKKISDKQNFEFRMECRAFLAGVASLRSFDILAPYKLAYYYYYYSTE